MDAAVELILHYGYDKTTVADIARTAGVSKGAIYLHWKSKDDLLEACIWREFWRYSKTWIKRMEEAPDGGTLPGLYRTVLETLSDNPFMMALFGQRKHVLGSFLPRSKNSLFTQRFLIGMEFMRMMQEAGVVREDIEDLEAITYALNLMSWGFLKIDEAIPPEMAPSLERTFSAISYIVDRALTPDEGANSEGGKAVIGKLMVMLKNWFPEGGPGARPAPGGGTPADES